tara:strand:- start:464 stop:1120 length:657 start_codon:yes stop_codon:yes gene_type:complete
MPTYTELEYSLNESSLKDYPQKLCNYLSELYLPQRGKLLDVGCGRGFYAMGFRRLGYQAEGIDSRECDMDGEWSINFEKDKLPHNDFDFDIVFTKSTIEHIFNTQHFLSEIYRVLYPKGVVICLTPDWSVQVKNFYDDSTHIKPFTKKGLKQAFLLAGFQEIKCDYFYPTPFYWKYPYMKFLPYLVRLLPDTTKYRGGKQNKIIRFSKERMLLLRALK